MARYALTALDISHFRSHRQTSLRLDGRPLVIYGPNGAGKTNILEAVSMLSPGRGLRRAQGAELMQRQTGIGWKITATVESEVQPHEIALWAEPDDRRQTRVDGKAATQTALARLVRMLWLVPAMDRLWIEGAEGRRRFLDRMTLSFAPDHAEAALAYEKAMRGRNRLLKEGVRDAHWYRALEVQMAEHGAQLAANRRAALARLTAAQDVADSAFPKGTLALTGPEGEDQPEARDDILAALADNRARDMAAGRTLRGPHRVDLEALFAAKGVPAAQSSTGEQKALLISLILANARALRVQIGAAPILLLDEVAAHLDANRRAALYDEICALGAQAFLTGTDRELFTALGARGSALAVADISGLSTISEKTL